MTGDQHDDILEQSVQDDLGSPGSAHAAALREVADLLWESNQGAPPLREDPVAAMLGLIPDPAYSLDPRKLKLMRKRSGLKVSDLAVRLNARGWTIERDDLFRWESQASADAVPAVIKALADEVGVSPDELVSQQPRALPAAITGVLDSSVFSSLVERWARVQNTSAGMAASQLESRLLATVYRGDAASTDQMVQALQALVTATEESRQPRNEP